MCIYIYIYMYVIYIYIYIYIFSLQKAPNVSLNGAGNKLGNQRTYQTPESKEGRSALGVCGGETTLSEGTRRATSVNVPLLRLQSSEGKFSWKPSSTSNVSIRAFLRTYPLIEIRQTAPCRAIRDNSISVIVPPPS